MVVLKSSTGASRPGATTDLEALNERDVCTKRVTPALLAAGWDRDRQLREEVRLTDGRILVRGKLVARGKRKRADYVLSYHPNVPVAVVEAKDANHSVGDGMQQALAYAELLDVPFAFSTNGRAFLFHDRTATDGPLEREIPLDAFPSPTELWEKYCAYRRLSPTPTAASERTSISIAEQPYYSAERAPRYYQARAINKVVEAIARGEKRALLVMATGTGKTYTAFQIIWRLWKARVAKRTLFLADRNILVDQTKTNDFAPFEGVMTKITNRKVDKSFEIYLALYQAIMGTEEEQDIFKQFSPDFFDLIVIDECHRGSAADDSAWRRVLEYFSSATQLGLTATPKETSDVSTSHYFGEPIDTYSLKQGIEDGFLAPYKVVRIDLDRDLQGWRPEAGALDKNGHEIEDRIYTQKDFDRNLVLEQRTELVAKRVTQFLKESSRKDKTIVFCQDIDHAERSRQALFNENSDLCAANRKYVMRITGDNPEGKAELDNFIHPEEEFPTIVTTSKLLTTGVDCKTCKVIVLDQNIASMTEFKQIIGRGTRIDEAHGKLYFTILDFRKATELFADPAFDGDPEQVYVPRLEGADGAPGDPLVPPPSPLTSEDRAAIEEVLLGAIVDVAGSDGVGTAQEALGNRPFDRAAELREGSSSGYGASDETPEKPKRYVVGDVAVHVLAERVQYYGNDGTLVTESLRDYSRSAIRERYASLDAFLKTWRESARRDAILAELHEHGLFLDALASDVGRDLSAFDLICHIAFDQPALTRSERAKRVRAKAYFEKYGDTARAVLDALLEKFADSHTHTDVPELENLAVLRVDPLSQLGTPVELVRAFGGKDQFQKAIRELEDALFEAG